MTSTNKMAPNSRRIGWSGKTFASQDEAKAAAQAYMAALEPRYQAGRSFKVTKMIGGGWAYDIYLGERPRETYRFYDLRLDAWQTIALETMLESYIAGEPMPAIHKDSLAPVLEKLQAALRN